MPFWVFLTNLKGPVFWAGILGLIVCAVIAIWSGKVRSEEKDGSIKSMDAQWRQIFALKVSLAIIVGYIIIQSIPAPEYNIRFVDKPTYIEKKVEVVRYATPQQTYLDIYNTCIASARYSDDNNMKVCHDQAIAAVSPPERIVYRVNTYKSLFDSCNESWTGAIQAMQDPQVAFKAREERMELCHRSAMEGSKFH